MCISISPSPPTKSGGSIIWEGSPIYPFYPINPILTSMVMKQSQNPYGYRNLLVYKKAEELQIACSGLTHLFPKTKTLIALADQMDRSARSTKQNITEGWKRNTTNEYYQFLGFAIASNAELEEDCTDIWKGIYPELMGLRGIMGEKGERVTPYLSHLPPLTHTAPFDIEKLPFYPLDSRLPPVAQLKLRCKELNFLLDRLQRSLLEKMAKEHKLSAADKLKRAEDRRNKEELWYENMLREKGLVRLENGRVVTKEEWNKGTRSLTDETGEMGIRGEKGIDKKVNYQGLINKII